MVKILPDPPRFYRLSLGAGLFLFWILLSGQFNAIHLSLGFLSCLLVVWATVRFQILDWEGHPAHLGLRVFPYWFWLSIKVLQANAEVVWLILRDLLHTGNISNTDSIPTASTHADSVIDPVEGILITTQKTHLGQATYANSITLTPGTLTVAVEKNKIKVHALTRNALNELQQGEMDKRVTRLEGLS